MKILQTIISILFTILIVLAALGLLASLVVFAALGLGLLLNLLLHFQPFEATLLSLIALGVVLIIITIILTTGLPIKTTSKSDDDWDDDEWEEDDDWDNEWDDELEEDEKTPAAIVYPGIPRWRQPLKNVDFSNTKPDDRCPCGSGRKYKNCHGGKNAAR